ncbi:hypothetical protein Dcar01_02261 [Deinococcus carri]|uniref:eCIS core domain-containing protein n=1 Tax=Deinococcus carri TaxID=1211323 RepID=A0ABP9W842_9DEIO
MAESVRKPGERQRGTSISEPELRVQRRVQLTPPQPVLPAPRSLPVLTDYVPVRSLQRQAVQPVFEAAGERQQLQVQRQTERESLQHQITELRASLPPGAAPLPAPQSPTLPLAFQRQTHGKGAGLAPSPADWAGLYAYEMARHTPDARGMYPSAPVAALQRLVASGLAQTARTSTLPPVQRQAELGQALASLRRQPLGRGVVQGSLSQMVPGERLALQRALDEANETLGRQEAQGKSWEALQGLQRQLAAHETGASQPLLQQIQARRGAGNPLPAAVQRHLEQGLNHDLSRVRIHNDAEADRLAKGVNAVAFTTGTDIFFRRGKYEPNTQTGLELLAHEVTHVQQQAQGRVGAGVDPDAGLEAEAKRMGARLTQLRVRRPASRPPQAEGPATTGAAPLQRKQADPAKNNSTASGTRPTRPIPPQAASSSTARTAARPAGSSTTNTNRPRTSAAAPASATARPAQASASRPSPGQQALNLVRFGVNAQLNYQKDVFSGAYSGAKDMVTGLWNLGKSAALGAWNLTAGWATDPKAARNTWASVKGTAPLVSDLNMMANPLLYGLSDPQGYAAARSRTQQRGLNLWNGLKAPYQEAWQSGHPGQAVGRGLVDMGSLFAGGLGTVGKVGEGASLTGRAGETLNTFSLGARNALAPRTRIALPGGGYLEVPTASTVDRMAVPGAQGSSRAGGAAAAGLRAAREQFTGLQNTLDRILPPGSATGDTAKIRTSIDRIMRDAQIKIGKASTPDEIERITEHMRREVGRQLQGIDTSKGPFRASPNEVMYQTRQQAIDAAKVRAGIPAGAKPVDRWQVGSSDTQASIAKGVAARDGRGTNYVYSNNPGGYGQYEVYKTTDRYGRTTYRTVVVHTEDTNNFLPHVHAGIYEAPPSIRSQTAGTNGDKATVPDFRNDSYISVGDDHHLTYQYRSATTSSKAK